MTTQISKSLILQGGLENSVASVYKWVGDLFAHSDGYPVYFDKDNDEFANRSLTKFPCIVVQEIDTQDLTQAFIGGRHNLSQLLFYFYFLHSLKDGGSRRLLRRGRDQLMFALKTAGVTKPDGTVITPPIWMYDFSTKPETKLTSIISVMGGIQQRFTQEGDLLTSELMVTCKYPEVLF